jgi:1-acyl-sn-glycerol-3-phosphate acyltransferase
MKKIIYEWIFFRLLGWKIIGNIDPQIVKCVMMVMPHTSWHDFYLGVFTRGIIGLEMNWVGKKELFRFPLENYFKYMGGTPLDRKGGLNKVEAITAIFNNKTVFRLAIAPEGTRKAVSSLKTGFYYIAMQANVPIIAVAFDFGKKEVRFEAPFYPTGNLEKDMIALGNHFVGVKGKIAANGFDTKLITQEGL